MANTRNNSVTPAVTMESLQKTMNDIKKLVQDLQEAMTICNKNRALLQLNGQNPGNHQNNNLLSNNVKDSSCGLHVIGNVDDLVLNDSHCEVDLGKNECAHKMFDQMSRKGEEFEVSDAFVKESTEEENRLVEDVVVETVKEPVEWENEVIDDDKVNDDIKVKTSKGVESEFLVMEVDGFVTDKNRSKLRPHKNNDSFVHRIKGFHLLGMYVDEGYVEGWEDEDKDLNVFDYVSGVYDLSTKALLGEKEFIVNKKQEGLDKIKRVIKQESVKELVDGNNGLVDDNMVLHRESTKDGQVGVDNSPKDGCSFNQGYVHKTNTNGEFILKAEQVFDPGEPVEECISGVKMKACGKMESAKAINGSELLSSVLQPVKECPHEIEYDGLDTQMEATGCMKSITYRIKETHVAVNKPLVEKFVNIVEKKGNESADMKANVANTKSNVSDIMNVAEMRKEREHEHDMKYNIVEVPRNEEEYNSFGVDSGGNGTSSSDGNLVGFGTGQNGKQWEVKIRGWQFDFWKWPKRKKTCHIKYKFEHGKLKFDVWRWPNRKKKWEETRYGPGIVEKKTKSQRELAGNTKFRMKLNMTSRNATARMLFRIEDILEADIRIHICHLEDKIV
ncbi:hypothetical protein Tco_0588334 [Tanacetum coccineum]